MAMTLRLPDELTEEVRRQADTEHMSMQLLVQKACREYVVRHSRTAAIDEAMEKIQGRYGEVLRRLGE
jgi:predicted transcriptional regulator